MQNCPSLGTGRHCKGRTTHTGLRRGEEKEKGREKERRENKRTIEGREGESDLSVEVCTVIPERLYRLRGLGTGTGRSVYNSEDI